MLFFPRLGIPSILFLSVYVCFKPRKIARRRHLPQLHVGCGVFMLVAVAIIANATTGVCLSTEIPRIRTDAACQELLAFDFSLFSR